MKLVGLTGGIASGKSTVSALLRELGAPILDADELAREVVQPGTPALMQISARFPGVLAADGTLDRAKLGKRIFSDPHDRRILNEIVHPRIQQAFLERTEALRRSGARVAVYDAPLLIENNLQAAMNEVVVVSAAEPLQLRRLMERNGLSSDQARARISSQLPLGEKLKHATYVIENDGSMEALRARVTEVWKSILGKP